MILQNIKAEVDHCRHRLMKYCRGQGLDLGCGASKIRFDAIGIDISHPAADMKYDARLLPQYKNESFDYIFSSHLLEEIDNTEATLREWLRIIKNGGYLVLYQAHKDRYFPLGSPQCNKNHKHHFYPFDLMNILNSIGGIELIHTNSFPSSKEWSFELVIQKNNGTFYNILPSNDGISILIPTYNRYKNIIEFINYIDKTTSDPKYVEVIFGVHEDDKQSITTINAIIPNYKIKFNYQIINRYHDNKINLSYLWNQLYNKSNYNIIGYFGDDVLFHTPGWDIEIRKEFNVDKTIMVCCNDVHIQKGKTATLFFTHKCVHSMLGFYLDERFRRWYNDTMLDVIYRKTSKLHYREDLFMEHLHPDKFPERIDSVYKNMESVKDQDIRLWHTQEIQKEILSYIIKLKNFNPVI